jgi:uncharacterized protein involved in exopolysaccharide biosynthesis
MAPGRRNPLGGRCLHPHALLLLVPMVSIASSRLACGRRSRAARPAGLLPRAASLRVAVPMQPSFDPIAFAAYLRERWRFIAAVCGVAIAVTLVVSLMLPKKYTARASLLIEPPGNADLRTATAVSPVYLESLKSYEHFAASDTLFRKAMDRFQLRGMDGGSIESVKRRVLRVSKLRDTRILEISVTLPDPKQAQALAQFLAEETLKLNDEFVRAGDRSSVGPAAEEQEAARRELEKLQSTWQEVAGRESHEALKADIEALNDLKSRVLEGLVEARVEAAGDSERLKENAGLKAAAAASLVRAAALEKQSDLLDRELKAKGIQLARLGARRQSLESELKAAQASFDAATARVREMRSSIGTRGERLRIIDPGIVPERPSSPNIPLNVLIALATALLVSLVYLGLAWQARPSLVSQRLRSTATRANG